MFRHSDKYIFCSIVLNWGREWTNLTNKNESKNEIFLVFLHDLSIKLSLQYYNIHYIHLILSLRRHSLWIMNQVWKSIRVYGCHYMHQSSRKRLRTHWSIHKIETSAPCFAPKILIHICISNCIFDFYNLVLISNSSFLVFFKYNYLKSSSTHALNMWFDRFYLRDSLLLVRRTYASEANDYDAFKINPINI